MKLATFTAAGGAAPLAGVVEGETIRELASGVTVVDVLAGAEPATTEAVHALADVQLQAPVPAPGTIYAAGLNYAEHVRETGGQAPQEPIIFIKALGSVAAPGGPIRCPEVVRRLDYEGELTIVMGRHGEIAGYCVADDVSARDLQRREPQWTRAKGADTFCPVGPWVTTADEVGDAGDLRLRTWVNGDLRQDARTSDLIFSCEELVAFISQTCTLRPGDLILTGTPNGVGMALDPPAFLRSGDVVRIEIEKLGVIEHAVE